MGTSVRGTSAPDVPIRPCTRYQCTRCTNKTKTKSAVLPTSLMLFLLLSSHLYKFVIPSTDQAHHHIRCRELGPVVRMYLLQLSKTFLICYSATSGRANSSKSLYSRTHVYIFKHSLCTRCRAKGADVFTAIIPIYDPCSSRSFNFFLRFDSQPQTGFLSRFSSIHQ